jgi:hypothetical protein
MHKVISSSLLKKYNAMKARARAGFTGRFSLDLLYTFLHASEEYKH